MHWTNVYTYCCVFIFVFNCFLPSQQAQDAQLPLVAKRAAGSYSVIQQGSGYCLYDGVKIHRLDIFLPIGHQEPHTLTQIQTIHGGPCLTELFPEFTWKTPNKEDIPFFNSMQQKGMLFFHNGFLDSVHVDGKPLKECIGVLKGFRKIALSSRENITEWGTSLVLKGNQLMPIRLAESKEIFKPTFNFAQKKQVARFYVPELEDFVQVVKHKHGFYFMTDDGFELPLTIHVEKGKKPLCQLRLEGKTISLPQFQFMPKKQMLFPLNNGEIIMHCDSDGHCLIFLFQKGDKSIVQGKVCKFFSHNVTRFWIPYVLIEGESKAVKAHLINAELFTPNFPHATKK